MVSEWSSDVCCCDVDERVSDTDGEPGTGSANDHHATSEPDSDGGTDGDVYGDGGRNGAAHLPVAEEWSEHRGGDFNELYDAGDHDFRQRIGVRGSGDEHGRDGDERVSDTDGEPGTGSANDHHATSEPDSDGGTDGDVYGDGGRNGAAHLPVAEEWSEHRGGDFNELYDAGDHDFRQRIGVRGSGDEHGRDGDERVSDTDGECGTGSANDHHATSEPDSDGGTDGDVYGDGGRNGAAHLPVAEERSEHRGGDFNELYDAGDHDFRQRIGVQGSGDEHGWDGDERVSDTDGECGTGSANDHHAASEPDSDGGTDSDVYGDGGRNAAADLRVAEERSEHRGGDVK